MTHPPQPGNWGDPSWPAPDPTQPVAAEQPVSGQPVGGYPPAQPAFGQGPAAEGYAPPAYGYPGYGYPVMAPRPTNGLAVAALVVSIVSFFALCVYGIGGYIGVVGAVLGHVARRQIRTREQVGQPEEGAGMALGGIIVGWIATAIAVVATVIIVVVIVAAINGGGPSAY